jgi:hypothetical protein
MTSQKFQRSNRLLRSPQIVMHWLGNWVTCKESRFSHEAWYVLQCEQLSRVTHWVLFSPKMDSSSTNKQEEIWVTPMAAQASEPSWFLSCLKKWSLVLTGHIHTQGLTWGKGKLSETVWNYLRGGRRFQRGNGHCCGFNTKLTLNKA